MFDFFILVNGKIFLVLFLYGFVMSVARRRACGLLMQKPGSTLLANFFNLIGTPVHECGHLIFGLLFGYKITEVCLFKTMRQAARTDGTLGYVRMSRKKTGFLRQVWNDVGGFFIGIGPLLSGPFVMALLYRFLPERIHRLFTAIVERSGLDVLKDAATSMTGSEWAVLIAYVVIAIGISINMELSKADLNMVWAGFLVLEILALFVSLVLFQLGISVAAYIDIAYHFLLLVAAIGLLCVGIANALLTV